MTSSGPNTRTSVPQATGKRSPSLIWLGNDMDFPESIPTRSVSDLESDTLLNKTAERKTAGVRLKITPHSNDESAQAGHSYRFSPFGFSKARRFCY